MGITVLATIKMTNGKLLVFADQYGIPYYYKLNEDHTIITELVGEYVDMEFSDDCWLPISVLYPDILRHYIALNTFAYKFEHRFVTIRWFK